MDKNSNYIGAFFKNYITQYGITSEMLAQRLGFDYANNVRMISAYKVKKDYLWKQSEVIAWCKALRITEKMPVYNELLRRAGKKDG